MQLRDAVNGRPRLKKETRTATIKPTRDDVKEPVELSIAGKVREASVTYGA